MRPLSIEWLIPSPITIFKSYQFEFGKTTRTYATQTEAVHLRSDFTKAIHSSTFFSMQQLFELYRHVPPPVFVSAFLSSHGIHSVRNGCRSGN
jgi:hypothetical protein